MNNHKESKIQRINYNFLPISKKEEELATKIVDSAFQVHKNLGPGLIEKVYEVCFCHELSNRKIQYKKQVKVPIIYDNIKIYNALRLDILVKDKIICELKAAEKINIIWKAQILSYMKLTKKRLGFIINFNVPLIKDGIKRIIL